MAQSNQIIEIFKARENLLKQLSSQGFDVEDYEGSNINEVNLMFLEKQMDMLVTNPKTKQKTYVKYHLEKGKSKSLRVANIQDFIEDLFHLENILERKDNLIIITKDEPNESLIKSVKNIWEQQNVYIILYNIKRLQFNILDHELVPRHTILSEEDAKKMREKYNIERDSQIPDISRFGPVTLAIGMRPGDICEVERPSRTSIKTMFYRICSQ
uniref:RNA polymerase subunit H/Rpb5 C-terminal domain-containing protein n=1 Tax=viral metagenome TaxID=1070528 RepID=A0A6C0C0B0_9ZZZZ